MDNEISFGDAPQGSQSQCDFQIDFTDLAQICELMPRRLLVTGILIQWLRQHFSDPNKIENLLLQNTLWDEDIAVTKIAIDSVFKFNAAQTEHRPGIFIKPGPWKVLRYGIDDRKMLNAGETACCNNKNQYYNTMYQGSHTVFCIAGESAEVEILAAETYREIIQFGPVARKLFNFLRFVVSDIGEPAILEEATENFVVPIVVSYGVQDMWRICPPCCEDPDFFMGLWNTLNT